MSSLVAFALLAPILTSSDPNTSDFERGVGPLGSPAAPSVLHLLGTDTLYRDELARLAYGAQLSLTIALSATALSLVVGASVGVVAGFFEGRPIRVGALSLPIDDALMRLVDVGLSFPFLLLVMAVGATVERTGATTVLWILGLTGWLGMARIIRGKTIQLRNLDYVLAARALGQNTVRILLLHIVPNLTGILVVVGTISVAQMILAESVLSYLSLGVSPPTATWGRMLLEGQERYMTAPWLLLAPGTAIVVAVLGFNLLGEGLRNTLDPRSR